MNASAPEGALAWDLAAGASIALSLSVGTEISLRFLGGGTDWIGAFSAMVQVLLAILASSTFTEAGRAWLDRVLERRGKPQCRRAPWRAGIAAAVLGLIVALRLSLPVIAIQYNNHGQKQAERGEITSALRSFRRAISLAPDLAVAHYNLAGSEESLGDYDAAVGEYRLAREAAPHRYEIYNNLARLYLLHQKNPSAALDLIFKARQLGPKEPRVLYSLAKNAGWAELDLGLLHVAERDLRQAIELDDDGPAAHCLLAQLLETRQSPGASQEWSLCRSLAPGREDEMAPAWLSQAEERLSAAGRNP